METHSEVIAAAIESAWSLKLVTPYDLAAAILVALDEHNMKIVKRPTKREGK